MMSTQINFRTNKRAVLEGAVRGAVNLTRSALSRLAAAVLHEDPHRPELQVLEDAMKVLTTVVENLAWMYLDEPVCSLDKLDRKYRQHNYELQKSYLTRQVRKYYLTRQVEDAVVKQLQDEIKDLRRRRATFHEGGNTLVELEKVECMKLAAEVQHVEEETVSHNEYSALVQCDMASNASEFRRVTSRLQHALRSLEDNLENLEERADDWARNCTYEIFLKKCQQLSEEAIAGVGCATTDVTGRAAELQKVFLDGMKNTAVSLLLDLHGRIAGSDVRGPKTEVGDAEARIGDLERKILAHHDKVKLQAGHLLHSLADVKKRNDRLKKNIRVCERHIKELQEMIGNRKKLGIHGEVPSEGSP